MPEQFLHLNSKNRKEILQTAATQLGREANVLEKDVWVCWTLQALFSMHGSHPMAFKGGTSLSKTYGAIDRFSEDVDVTLDYRKFGDEFDPFADGVSRTAIKKFSERLKGFVFQYSIEKIVPHLKTKLEAMPDMAEYGIEISENGEEIRIQYPSAIEIGADYLDSSILVELGGRNVIDPNERHTINCDISALATDLDFPSASVVVLSPERTFWEKATLIHVECNRNKFKANADRLSRHWYDLYMLAAHDTGKAAMNNRELLRDVIRYKKVFFNSSYANYEECLSNQHRLIPNDETMKELRLDYEKMMEARMIYGKPPSFDSIITGIREIERRINGR